MQTNSQRHRRQGMGEGKGASMPSPGAHLSPYLYVLPTKQLCKPCFFFFFLWVLKEASLHGHDCFNPLADGIDSTARFSPPQKSRGGTKNSSPLITCRLLLATSSHPWIGFKSYLCWSIYRNWRWETKYYPVAIITQKIPTVYGVMSKEVRMMTNICEK